MSTESCKFMCREFNLPVFVFLQRAAKTDALNTWKTVTAPLLQLWPSSLWVKKLNCYYKQRRSDDTLPPHSNSENWRMDKFSQRHDVSSMVYSYITWSKEMHLVDRALGLIPAVPNSSLNFSQKLCYSVPLVILCQYKTFISSHSHECWHTLTQTKNSGESHSSVDPQGGYLISSHAPISLLNELIVALQSNCTSNHASSSLLILRCFTMTRILQEQCVFYFFNYVSILFELKIQKYFYTIL